MSSAVDMLDFEGFARESLGEGSSTWKPYPWQVRFAERWADADSEPPTWVIAPTGAGKTAAIDALVWALARQADIPAVERTAATRIVWAIDRRVLVDEVYEHASALANRLDDALDAGPDADPLHGVALRLYRLACADRTAQPLPRAERERLRLRPLAVQRWRGGIANREELHHPFQPQVITATVAQIGSRLLFRGYGVGERSLQVAAGLAATDTTICLDEAHLALPFRETAAAIEGLRGDGELRLPPFNLLTLTATPPSEVADDGVVELDEADRVRLGKRWNGEKTLELRSEDKKPETALTAAVEELLDGDKRIVACVTNKVRTARNVHRALEKKLGEAVTVVLLIGPQRPADRESELARVHGALFEGKEPERPIVVVATQTIEVGLDADFDAMVSQSASASALAQRLGRLNRSGDRPGRCILIRDTNSPLYERDEPRAWEWLKQRPGAPNAIDVSVQAMASDDTRPSDSQPPLAATLTPAIVEQLSQTSPRPASFANPDIEPLLNGIGAEPNRDVQIVWRRDLRFSMSEDDADRWKLRTYREALLTLAPPEPREILSVSIAEARRMLRTWLADPSDPRGRQATGGDDVDLEGGEAAAVADPAPPPPSNLAAFIVVRGRQILHGANRPQGTDTIALSELAPRDTIVVPTRLWQVRFGVRPLWGPGAIHDDALGDQGEHAEPQSGLALRFSWDALGGEATSVTGRSEDGPSPRDWLEIAKRLHDLTAGRPDAPPISAAALRAELGEELRALPAAQQATLAALEDEGASLRLRRATMAPLKEVLEAAAEEDPEQEVDRGVQRPGESEASRLSEVTPFFDQAWVATRAGVRDREEAGEPQPQTLAEHCVAVRERAARFGRWLQLPEPQREALELAALAHDVGKVDPRFQDFLWGGSAPAGRDPLAKSIFGADNRAPSRVARDRANLPRRLRHEAASVAMLDSALRSGTVPDDLDGADQDLSLLLTGSHHGYGMPLWPVEEGGQSAIGFEANLLGIAGRASGTNRAAWLEGRWMRLLFDLRERFGHWELAYIQALIALADRTVSREEG